MVSDIVVDEEVEDQPCLVCGKDTDHSKLLMCDKCDGPYHIYCLDPPLKKIPVEDWFCGRSDFRNVRLETHQFHDTLLTSLFLRHCLSIL